MQPPYLHVAGQYNTATDWGGDYELPGGPTDLTGGRASLLFRVQGSSVTLRLSLVDADGHATGYQEWSVPDGVTTYASVAPRDVSRNGADITRITRLRVSVPGIAAWTYLHVFLDDLQSTCDAPELSSSSVTSSSSEGLSSSSELPSSSSASPQPVVGSQLFSMGPNYAAVNLRVQNLSVDALDEVTLHYYLNWADHSSHLVPEVDYSSIGPMQVTVDERGDYIADVSIPLGSLTGNADIRLNLRFHTEDQGPMDFSNDPSFAPLVGVSPGASEWHLSTGIVLESPDGVVWGSAPNAPFPPEARQEVHVVTTVSEQSASTLGLFATLVNTGEVPVKDISWRYYLRIPQGSALPQSVIDYSQVPGATVTVRDVGADPSTPGMELWEAVYDLGNYLLPIGTTREIHLRLFRDGWADLEPEDDPSYAGVGLPGGNPQVAVYSGNRLLGGTTPWAVDSDGDGYPDAVEERLGTDPTLASDYPEAGIPDQPVVSDPTHPTWVTYDFSQIPGFSSRGRIAVQYQPGTLVDGQVPVVEVRSAPVTGMRVSRSLTPVGPVFQVHAEAVSGQEIEVAIPAPDQQSTALVASDFRVFRLDTVAGQWEERTVVDYDGAIHVRSDHFSPVRAYRDRYPVSLSATGQHILLVDSVHVGSADEYRVVAAGANDRGQLGTGQESATTSNDYLHVVESSGGLGSNVKAVAAGYKHSLAVTTEGKVFSWGDNTYGQLGRTTSTTYDATPKQVMFPVASEPVIVAVVAGWYHSFAIDENDQVWAWGHNDRGQLGLLADDGSPSTEDKVEPVQLLDASGNPIQFRQLAGGENFSLGVEVTASGGELVAWGDNTNGQVLGGLVVGTPSSDGSSSWQQCPDRWTLSGTDEIYGRLSVEPECWGKYGYPTSAIRADDPRPRILDAGKDFGVLWRMLAGGTLGLSGYLYDVSWGLGGVGVLDAHAQMTNRLELGAGTDHYVSITQYHDWSVRMRGNNAYGQLGSSNIAISSNGIAFPIAMETDPQTGEDVYLPEQSAAIPAWVDAGDHYTTLKVNKRDPNDGARSSELRMYGTWNGQAYIGAENAKVLSLEHGALPDISISVPSGPTNADPVVVSGTAPSGTSLTVGMAGKTTDITANASGTWNASFSGVSDGVYDVSARVNVGAWMVHRTCPACVTVDRTPPVVEITSPAGDVVVPQGVTSIAVSWTVDGEPQTGQTSFTIDASNCTGTTDGSTCTITRSATDAAGNTGSANVTFSIGPAAELSELVVSGDLRYPGGLTSTDQQVWIQVSHPYSGRMGLGIWPVHKGPGTTNETCKKSLGVKASGSVEVRWDGMCDDGSWVGEGAWGVTVYDTVEYVTSPLTASGGGRASTARTVFKSLSTTFGNVAEIPFSLQTSADSLLYVQGLLDDYTTGRSLMPARRVGTTASTIQITDCADGKPFVEAGEPPLLKLVYYPVPTNSFFASADLPQVRLGYGGLHTGWSQDLQLGLDVSSGTEWQWSVALYHGPVADAGLWKSWAVDEVAAANGVLETVLEEPDTEGVLQATEKGWKMVKVEAGVNDRKIADRCWGVYED